MRGADGPSVAYRGALCVRPAGVGLRRHRGGAGDECSGHGATAGGDLAGGAVAGNQIAVIPNTVGVYDVNFPFFNGLAIVPGAGQTVAVSYT